MEAEVVSSDTKCSSTYRDVARFRAAKSNTFDFVDTFQHCIAGEMLPVSLVLLMLYLGAQLLAILVHHHRLLKVK